MSLFLEIVVHRRLREEDFMHVNTDTFESSADQCCTDSDVNPSTASHDQAHFLTVVTFKTVYERFLQRRSVTNAADVFHSSSN